MALIRVPARPVKNLDDLPIDTATKVLESALSDFYRPSPQDIQAIRRIVGIALAHALTNYASEEQFVRLAKCRAPIVKEPPIIMLTGLGGVGKSEISKALERLLLSHRRARISADLPEFPITPLVTTLIGPNVRHVDVMNAVADCLGLEASRWDMPEHHFGVRVRSNSTYIKADRDSIRHAKLRLYQQGVCCILGDEFQFLTRSREANALITKLVAFFAVFGVPVVYICNYSAGHRLKMRPQEDRTRLLHDPIVVLPDPPDEPTYLDLLEDYKVVFGGALDIDPKRDALAIHEMTFGLKRSAKRLLVIGYRIARSRTKKGEKVCVDMTDLRAAYMSISYEDDRKTVEECHSILMGIATKCEDLICPFDLPPSLVEVQRRLAENALRRRHNHAMHNASMTPLERTAAKEVQVKRDTAKGKLAVPIQAKRRKRASVTAKDLLKSALF